MATVSKWTPFGVALDITATAGTVTRTSATQFTVKINASWKTTWNTTTNYGMTASSGGGSVSLNADDHKADSGSGTFTGTYSISGNGSATKSITVTFRNYNDYHKDSATKAVSFNVTVPAWTSYTVSYNKNTSATVSNMPASQTKWKSQLLTLSSTKPTRTGYTFQKWNTKADGTGTNYYAGGSYAANAAATLYAVWKVNTWTITYNANGGSGAPGTQTKNYGTTLTLSNTIPTRKNYNFKGWATSASATTAQYKAGGSYTANAGATLYAVWELAYVKPQINDVTVERGGYNPETGKWESSDNGTTALIEFDWDTFLDVKSVVVTLESAGRDKLTYTQESATGNSGGFTLYVGNDTPLSTDSTYTVKITVIDANGSTTLTRTLPGMKFAIDFRAGGTGAAVGKPAEIEGYFDVGYKTRLRDELEVDKEKPFYSYAPDGAKVEFMHPMNQHGNVVIGYGNYDRKAGNTNIYGYDVNIGISSITTPGYYRPYRRKDDAISFTLDTAGYVTNSGKSVTFTVPFAVPIVGNPTVTITSNKGFILRQGEHYTHGSSATTYVSTDITYTARVSQWMGVTITATFTDTTNVINNNAIGVHWSGYITFT